MRRWVLLLLLALAPAVAQGQEAAPPLAPVTNPVEARSEVERILAEPEFVLATEPAFLEQFAQWVYTWLDNMDADLRAYEFIGQLTRISYVLMWLILIGSFLSLGYWIFRVFKLRQWTERREAEETARMEALLEADLESELCALDSSQPTVRGMLRRWREFFGQLSRRELIPPGKALTNREAIRVLPTRDEGLRAELEQLAGHYDRHVFGHQPLDDADAAQWNERLAEAEERLQPPAEAAR
ncbi:MAG: DUF4129 domain-containing protein [Verrucomicrobiota bacterium]